MTVIDGEIVIERLVEDVFDYVADERNEPQFNSRMSRVELVTPEPIGAGSRFLAESRMMGGTFEVAVEYTVFERPRLLGSRSRSTPRDRKGRSLMIEGSLSFEPVPEGTRMRWSWQVETPGALRLITPLLAWMGRRQERAVWTALKHLLEHPQARQPSSPRRKLPSRSRRDSVVGPVAGRRLVSCGYAAAMSRTVTDDPLIGDA